MKKKDLFPTHNGLRLFRLPELGRERENTRRRNIQDLHNTTAAAALAAAGVSSYGATLFCGGHSAALPFLRQLTKKAEPYVVLGTPKDLGVNDCLFRLPHDWKNDRLLPTLPDGNGFLTLRPSDQTRIDLTHLLQNWEHYVILCLGNGLQLDAELLDRLNERGGFVLLTESLNKGVRSADENKLTLKRVLTSMDYLLISSIGQEFQDLVEMLPRYQEERVSNTLDWQSYRNGFNARLGHRSGKGFRISQTRSLEEKPILRQEDIRTMEAQRRVFLLNTHSCDAYTAAIVR